jgi:hypothetical protein
MSKPHDNPGGHSPKQAPVFISHASEDLSVARDLCQSLERHGLRCWLAPQDIRPGEEYSKAIIVAIRNCSAMVVILSAHANRSSHVRNEIERAASYGIPLITFRIANIPPDESLELFLGGRQWMDAFTPPRRAQYEALAQVVSASLGEGGTGPRPPRAALPRFARDLISWRSRGRWALGLLILLAGSGSLLASRLRDKPGEPPMWGRLTYFEPFDAPSPELWLHESSGDWDLALDHGAYCLSNPMSAHQVHYIHVGAQNRKLAEAPVSVEVNVVPAPGSETPGAGLIYRFDLQTGHYYAFVLSRNRDFAFYKRNESGYLLLAAGSSDKINEGKPNKLGLLGRDNTFSLYINDTLVKEVKDTKAPLQGDDTGILAMDQGRYCFDNFSLYSGKEKLPGRATGKVRLHERGREHGAPSHTAFAEAPP